MGVPIRSICLWILVAGASAVSLLAQQRPKITGVAHIAVYAKDFEAARVYYRDFLGFAEPYSLKNADGSPSMTFFKVNERQYIELFPEREPGSDRLNHISIETDNAEAMRVYLKSKGVQVPDKVGKGRIGNSNFNIKDPEGHTVEIVQYEPAGWTVREKGKHLPQTRISARILHVGIIVMKFDEVMRFYREVLGFREIWRGGRDPKVLSWVNLKVPDGDDYVELMLHREWPAPTQRGVAHHVALEVPEIQASVATLEKRRDGSGYARPIEVRTGVNRKRQANLFDPDGTRAELMEPNTVDGKPAPVSTAPPPKPEGGSARQDPKL